MKTRLISLGHQLRVSDPQAATPAARPADCKWLIQFNNRNCSRCSRFYNPFHNDPAKRGYAVTYKELTRRPAKPAEPASVFSYQCLTRRKLRLAAQAPASLGNVARGLTCLWRADTNLEPRSARILWCRGPPSHPATVQNVLNRMSENTMTYFKPYVDQLFAQAKGARGQTGVNPVTGVQFVWGLDPIAPQKRDACRALVARAYFAWANPGLPPLPLSYGERESIKGRSGIGFILSVYARSFKAGKYDTGRHPQFERYACGVLASRYAPPWIKEDSELIKRFPPKELPGLGSGLYWANPSAAPRKRLR